MMARGYCRYRLAMGAGFPSTSQVKSTEGQLCMRIVCEDVPSCHEELWHNVPTVRACSAMFVRTSVAYPLILIIFATISLFSDLLANSARKYLTDIIDRFWHLHLCRCGAKVLPPILPNKCLGRTRFQVLDTAPARATSRRLRKLNVSTVPSRNVTSAEFIIRECWRRE